MTEALQIQLHYPEALPTLIYLPGLHGDWTLIGRFRQAIAGRVRLAAITYPRTLTWTLADYAREIDTLLKAHGITRGWLLGESFGSQVLWAMVERGEFRCDGLILAGGFVKHPAHWMVRLGERVAGGIPLSLLTRILFGYARATRFRHRHSPEVLRGIDEFLARRTELDRQAAKHRLHLIAGNNFCEVAQKSSVPLYAITGLLDPIVPWLWVRAWLRRRCPALKDYRVIWQADHNVLSTAAELASDQIVHWMKGIPSQAADNAPCVGHSTPG